MYGTAFINLREAARLMVIRHKNKQPTELEYAVGAMVMVDLVGSRGDTMASTKEKQRDIFPAPKPQSAATVSSAPSSQSDSEPTPDTTVTFVRRRRPLAKIVEKVAVETGAFMYRVEWIESGPTKRDTPGSHSTSRYQAHQLIAHWGKANMALWEELQQERINAKIAKRTGKRASSVLASPSSSPSASPSSSPSVRASSSPLPSLTSPAPLPRTSTSAAAASPAFGKSPTARKSRHRRQARSPLVSPAPSPAHSPPPVSPPPHVPQPRPSPALLPLSSQKSTHSEWH
jgi:hypothetical protein